jgi:plasmid stabilization system protein ParE
VQVIFLKRARSDFDRLRQFLTPHGGLLAERAVDALFSACYSLADQPERGRPAVPLGYRELIVPFGAGAYIVRYRIDRRQNAVVITRLWHGRERRV